VIDRIALVIDDEAQIRRVVRNALAPDFARVLEAPTGTEGIDLAAAQRPSLIVLDLGLPDMPGIEVCREIRRWSSAPLLVLSARLQEARLPLHVLLSSPFGSLNENQEELISAAQAALDAADEEVSRLRLLLAIDRGEHPPVPQRIRLTELLRPPLAVAEARARTAHVSVRTNISDTAHRVIADPLQLEAALTTLLTYAIAQVPSGGEVHLVAEELEPDRIHITITCGGPETLVAELPLDVRLARRLILLQQGTLPKAPGAIVINLPNEHTSGIFAR
jgi:CheY-like chemotaxis protein